MTWLSWLKGPSRFSHFWMLDSFRFSPGWWWNLPFKGWNPYFFMSSPHQVGEIHLLPTSQTHWGKWGSEMTKFPPIFGGYHLPIMGWSMPAFCYSNSPWWVDSLSWSPNYVSCKPCKSCLDFCCSIPKTITRGLITIKSPLIYPY